MSLDHEQESPSTAEQTVASDLGFEVFRHEVDQVLAELVEVGNGDLDERVQAARARLRTERLKIVVIGEFSRGKSTFINAMLGQPVLPSKVRPTTATINIIRGGLERAAHVEHLDGSTERLELPEKKINRFLDAVVTTANEQSNRIRVVTIVVPGKLEGLPADIVDTPGVNDLDQAREEITFRYLREADAAVLLLDASQPLSESERVFLKDKVFGSDVERIFYVINKADEVLLDGDMDSVARIQKYVARKLDEEVGVTDARVAAVSAKSALRSRYKGKPDPTPLSFDDFERELFEFASHHATSGRLQLHLDRLENLLEIQDQVLVEERSAFSLELDEIDRRLAELAERERLLVERTERLRASVDQGKDDLARRVADACRARTQHMRSHLTERIDSLRTDDDLRVLRGELSSSLRDLIEHLQRMAVAERQAISRRIEAEFGDLLETGVSPRQSMALDVSTDIGQVLDGYWMPSPSGGEGFDSLDVLIGGGLSYIGAALFGPVGIAAAVIGTWVVGTARSDMRAQEEKESRRQEMIQSLHGVCDHLATRAESIGQHVATVESDHVVNEFRERAATRRAAITATVTATRRAHTKSRETPEVIVDGIDRRRARLEELRHRARCLRAGGPNA